MLAAKTNCFTTPDKKSEIDFLLICFPFAGAGASYFNSWATPFKNSKIQLCGIQYPGRESRFHEPLISDISKLVSELSHQISEFAADIPFGFFGHSMGATIAHEVAISLSTDKQFQPTFMCLSGRNPPHTPKQSKDIDHLNDAEFIKEIEKLGNLSPQLIDDPDLMKYFLPIMRNDASLLRNYRPLPSRKLACPLDVYGGDNDPCTNIQALSEWERYTTMDFNLEIFSGNHFFINRYKSEICERLQNRISQTQPTV